MRLVTFKSADFPPKVGLISDERVVGIAVTNNPYPDMIEVIRAGIESVSKKSAETYALSDVQLLAPIPVPAKNIICVGKNYYEHAAEFHASGFDSSAGKDAIPEVPIIFTKPPTTVIGPGAAIQSALDLTNSVDYENELVVVIGKRGRGIRKGDALSHIFGYTIANDVTARTLQHRHKQWFLGKGLDTFCPMGPCILTADEVADPSELTLTTRVNGEIRQSARVADLIFDISTLIEIISSGMTLDAGDMIATGTPAGVGIGFQPPRFLRPGDVVSLSIDPIGTLENPVT